MKRIMFVVCALFLFSTVALAQQDPSDQPASKADIQRYLDVMHMEKMMNGMGAMSAQMRQIFHSQMAKNPNVTPEMLARGDKMLDEELKSIPVHDLMEAIVPVYQKYLTKGDVDALVAFYSTPRAQKLLAETPAMTADAIKASSGIIQEMMARCQARVQAEVAEMQKEQDNSAKKPAPIQN